MNSSSNANYFPVEPVHFFIAWLVVTMTLLLLAGKYGKIAVGLGFSALLYAALVTVGIPTKQQQPSSNVGAGGGGGGGRIN